MSCACTGAADPAVKTAVDGGGSHAVLAARPRPAASPRRRSRGSPRSDGSVSGSHGRKGGMCKLQRPRCSGDGHSASGSNTTGTSHSPTRRLRLSRAKLKPRGPVTPTGGRRGQRKAAIAMDHADSRVTTSRRIRVESYSFRMSISCSSLFSLPSFGSAGSADHRAPRFGRGEPIAAERPAHASYTHPHTHAHTGALGPAPVCG